MENGNLNSELEMLDRLMGDLDAAPVRPGEGRWNLSRGVWNTLETFAASSPPAAVMTAWREYAGPEFETMKTFLRATSRLAQMFPCLSAAGCGDAHEVVSLDDGRWVARSQEDLPYCAGIMLTEPDLVVYELDMERLCGALCRALGFEATPAASQVAAAPNVWPVGIHVETRSPVFLFLCPCQVQMLANLQGLAGNCGEPFIVLAPTAHVRSELVGSFLQRERCAFIPLDPCLAPDGAGFRLTSPVRPILDRFAAGTRGARSAGGANTGLRTTDDCAGKRESGKQKAEIEPGRKHTASSGNRGRLRYENDFLDIWLGDERYDLRERTKARLCIQYLFEKGAFDDGSALHFERQIDPYVRKHSKLEPLPRYAETKLHHYFNPSRGKFAQLGRDLIQSAGRGSGRYYLRVV